MAKPYIPAKDALFANFSANFASLIDDDPSTYGLVPGDAAVIVAAVVIIITFQKPGHH